MSRVHCGCNGHLLCVLDTVFTVSSFPSCKQMEQQTLLSDDWLHRAESILLSTLHWSPDVLCCRGFSTWQPNGLIPNIRPVSDSSNKRITSKLCFISQRLQSKTMNNRSQGTKSEPENLSSFYVSAVVGIHRELIKIHWLVTVLILWWLTVKSLG